MTYATKTETSLKRYRLRRGLFGRAVLQERMPQVVRSILNPCR